MKLKFLVFLVPVFLLLASYFAVSAQQVPNTQTSDYIVVLGDQVADSNKETLDITTKHLGVLNHSYSKALKGFSGSFSLAEIDKIKTDPRVKFVSEDKPITIAGLGGTPCCIGGTYFGYMPAPSPSPSPSPAPIPSPSPSPSPTPSPSPSPSPSPTPAPQPVTINVQRVNAPSQTNRGGGVGVAVIDTGINLAHPDLAANIVANTSCVPNITGGNDDNGHGTQIAGVVAAIDNTIGVVGVAPQAKLIAVKSFDLNGNGSWSQVICGIDWITANAKTYNIKVASMSFTGSGTSDNNCGNTNNDALHQAICNSEAKSGVVYIAAAGNSNVNVASIIPASYGDSVIAVSAIVDTDGRSGGLGSTTQWGADDTFANFSNYGSPIAIGAPGVNVYTTNGSVAYTTSTGTSFAAPHVSAAAALYINSHPGSTFAQVRSGLINAAEPLGSGHTDPSGLHPEPVLNVTGL